MKLRQLQCLCAVVDASFNISRAAEAVHATQPAVSKQLQLLEEELGLDLMVRHSGRLTGLTDLGAQTVEWARRALQCTDNIRALARESRGETGGRLVLATTHTHAKYILLPIIDVYRQLNPLVQVSLLQGTPDQIAELVCEGKADFGVVSLPSRLPKDAVAIPFRSSPLILITPHGHPLLKVKTVALEDLAAHPFVMISPSPLSDQIRERFHAFGLKPAVAYETNNSDVSKDFVAAGLGVAVISSFNFSLAVDHQLGMRDVSHLFDAQVSTVLFRSKSHLPRYAYAFLRALDVLLDRDRIDPVIFR